MKTRNGTADRSRRAVVVLAVLLCLCGAANASGKVTGGTAVAPAEPAPIVRPTVDPAPPAVSAGAPVGATVGMGFLSAGDLYARCNEQSASSMSYCFAYVTGVFDTVRAYENWIHFREFCAPLRVKQADLRNAFLTFAQQRPGELEGQAASVIVNALKRAYPCAVSLPPAAQEPPATGK